MRPSGRLAIVCTLLAGGSVAGAARLVVDRGVRVLVVTTDRPLYRPGETVWFRSWELAVRGFAPAQGAHEVNFELVDPRGAVVASRRVRADGHLARGDLALPAELAGGRYLLRARSDRGLIDERSLLVASYETPRLKKKLDFLKSSYGPGDVVTAVVKVERATGEAAAGARLEGLLRLDGANLPPVQVRTDRRGAATLRFPLPAAIRRGDALLTVVVSDGGATESIQRRVPILLRELTVELYPEGGELVAGLASRVYFRALDALGEPAEAQATIVDDTGREVARAGTVHGGMGRFELTPAPGRRYSLHVPGRAGVFPLPPALAAGCVLRAEDDFRSERPELGLEIACSGPRDVVVTAVLREELLDQERLRISGPTPVRLPVAAAQGAVRVTLFAADQTPLAERLIYRGWGRDPRVEVTADRSSYGPRDRVTLAIRTRDAAGRPVPAEVAVAVVDDAVLNLAGDKTGHLQARLYLEPEMPGQRIRDPNFYFSSDAKAPLALDLLLGTQGWRRFTWQWVP